MNHEIASPDRRRFLKMSGMLTIGVAAATVAPATGVLAFDRELKKVTRTRDTMSTFATITVMDPSVSRADQAIESAFNEMDRVARLFNRFDSASPVGVLNKEGRIRGLSPEVVALFQRSRAYHDLTGGAFDITVQPVVDLYMASFRRTANPPKSRELDQARGLVDGRGVVVSGDAVRLAKPGMGVTLDGIAKGAVIDAGARALQKAGIKHALVNAGGDIRAVGGKGGNRAWTVAVKNPQGERYLDTFEMTDGAVATSGNYEIYFDREKLFHHIINPTTGNSPVQSQSVSVRAKDVTEADALSTAVFVLGPHRGTELVSRLPNTECLILTRGGSRVPSQGWSKA